MSTRRTYEAISRALKKAHGNVNTDEQPGVEAAAQFIADELANENASFDAERFLRDAGVTP